MNEEKIFNCHLLDKPEKGKEESIEIGFIKIGSEFEKLLIEASQTVNGVINFQSLEADKKIALQKSKQHPEYIWKYSRTLQRNENEFVFTKYIAKTNSARTEHRNEVITLNKKEGTEKFDLFFTTAPHAEQTLQYIKAELEHYKAALCETLQKEQTTSSLDKNEEADVDTNITPTTIIDTGEIKLNINCPNNDLGNKNEIAYLREIEQFLSNRIKMLEKKFPLIKDRLILPNFTILENIKEIYVNIQNVYPSMSMEEQWKTLEESYRFTEKNFLKIKNIEIKKPNFELTLSCPNGVEETGGEIPYLEAARELIKSRWNSIGSKIEAELTDLGKNSFAKIFNYKFYSKKERNNSVLSLTTMDVGKLKKNLELETLFEKVKNINEKEIKFKRFKLVWDEENKQFYIYKDDEKRLSFKDKDNFFAITPSYQQAFHYFENETTIKRYQELTTKTIDDFETALQEEKPSKIASRNKEDTYSLFFPGNLPEIPFTSKNTKRPKGSKGGIHKNKKRQPSSQFFTQQVKQFAEKRGSGHKHKADLSFLNANVSFAAAKSTKNSKIIGNFLKNNLFDNYMNVIEEKLKFITQFNDTEIFITIDNESDRKMKIYYAFDQEEKIPIYCFLIDNGKKEGFQIAKILQDCYRLELNIPAFEKYKDYNARMDFLKTIMGRFEEALYLEFPEIYSAHLNKIIFNQ